MPGGSCRNLKGRQTSTCRRMSGDRVEAQAGTTHPGQSLIVVTVGTVTDYEGGDSDCKSTVYTQGMALVDSGGDHVHLIRNEGTAVAQTIAVQLTPAGAARRIDVPDPGNCHF